MIRWKGTRALRALAACGVLAVSACRNSTGFDVDGVRIYGLDGANNLVEFGSRSPDRVRRVPITGLQEGEVLVGIDFLPGDGRLFGVGSTNRLYVIDPRVALAAAVAAPFAPALAGEAFDVDFDPSTGVLRVQSTGGQNLRVGTGGSVAAVDAPLTYAPGDAGAFTNPRIAGAAYTTGSPATLYAIDTNRDALVTLPAPANGQARTVGPLGFNTSDDVGFDVVDTREGPLAFAVLSEGRVSRLYEVELATGALTPRGRLATRTAIRSISVLPGQDDRP